MTRNIQIKVKQGDSYIDVFPATKKELIEGLAEDFTLEEKQKLAKIAPEANKYIHPSTHPADMISQDTTHRFVSDSEKNKWNLKQDALGFTPENTANKGVANGYASLDANSKIPVSQLPDLAKSQTYVVETESDKANITNMICGDRAYIVTTGDSYIYDGTNWLVLSKAEWENINLQWENIVDKPSSSVSDIDNSVKKSHVHTNKDLLDKITGLNTKTYNLENYVTKDELGNAGYGDMLKSVYDADGDGIIDNAKKVNGHTVESDVPADAKFSDTIYTHPSTHPAAMITESSSRKFVSDSEKLIWNSKSKITMSIEQPTDDTDIWLQEI